MVVLPRLLYHFVNLPIVVVVWVFSSLNSLLVELAWGSARQRVSLATAADGWEYGGPLPREQVGVSETHGQGLLGPQAHRPWDQRGHLQRCDPFWCSNGTHEVSSPQENPVARGARQVTDLLSATAAGPERPRGWRGLLQGKNPFLKAAGVPFDPAGEPDAATVHKPAPLVKFVVRSPCWGAQLTRTEKKEMACKPGH
ncbi:hypothetical protein NDU88_004529 [Pleurodeles waltl]|uniref:Uncharacterized protein n=1 Tax=Pleurodeles waltl TaxID=8319 RepID=A0AAV7SJ25_PLEWA|nr:hypothetical protein NDU88_004529 [Pleurodeles waltl]